MLYPCTKRTSKNILKTGVLPSRSAEKILETWGSWISVRIRHIELVRTFRDVFFSFVSQINDTHDVNWIPPKCQRVVTARIRWMTRKSDCCRPRHDAVQSGRILRKFRKHLLPKSSASFFYHEDRSRRFFRNVFNILSDYKTPYPRRQ